MARETVVKSLDGHNLDLLTISDLNGIQDNKKKLTLFEELSPAAVFVVGQLQENIDEDGCAMQGPIFLD